jgi:thiol-disulfide isomerase/thioredoxin
MSIALIFVLQGLHAQVTFQEMTYHQAQEKAKSEGKHLFIDIYTTWCAPCKTLRSNLENSAEFAKATNANFLLVSIDAELEENKAFIRQKGISSFPSVLIISPSLNLELHMVGLQPVVNYIKEIEDFNFPEESRYFALNERYKKGERSTEFIQEYIGVLKKYNKPIVAVANDYFSRVTGDYNILDLQLLIQTISFSIQEDHIKRVTESWEKYKVLAPAETKKIANLYATLKISEYLRTNRTEEARSFVEQNLGLFQFSTGKSDAKQILYFFEGMAAEKI